MGQNTNEQVMFHVQLLSKLIDMNAHPFTRLVIEKGITSEEYHELLVQLNILNETFNKQCEEGLLDFTSLLVKFVGMLTEKLTPNQAVYALKGENYYPELMDVFIKIMKKNNLFDKVQHRGHK